ncbi:GDSL-type esterase/lipase family protein [Rhizomonospora bruguierae]|uniref:GDSL-type esterase/lipase family protein n=1 Tax=Rhizomonospora bruguierae TaxID=1581705 RepID=UPI001BCCDA16|nr:GDSL-type esterase/lipase family protein [Micromonospora sp. NBRC 107566]
MHTRARVTALLATALLTAVVAAGSLLVAHPAVSAAPAPTRIMPLGDSITGSPGCWRALLWNRLQSAGYTNVDFVGTLPPQGCGVPYDGDNEGHGGILATTMADQNQLPPWLSATRPDIVLMHLGTNDVWSGRSTETILVAFGKLVDQMRASNPSIRILLAQIIPMNPSSCPDCGNRVVALNNAIPAWAAARSTAQSPIVVVDQWTGFTTATDTGDGVHPNAAGDQKMSDQWFPKLTSVLTGATPTTGPTGGPTATPTRTPTTAPTGPSGGCSATYKVVGEWQDGFQGELTIRNTGSTTSTGWTARLVFPNGQTIPGAPWGAVVTARNGSDISLRNESYNGRLGPNATATAGFLGGWSGTNGAPAVSCALT